jgi:uncharacterized membrane protein YraQ (UPF0718 family)
MDRGWENRDSFFSNPVIIVSTFDDAIQEFFGCFTGILYEAMPFIVLGVVIAGILEELVPQQLIAKIIPRSRILAIAIGGFLGLLFPMCECGIIPVMRRLLRKGVPLSCCVCYMLAGPIINVHRGRRGHDGPAHGTRLPGRF